MIKSLIWLLTIILIVVSMILINETEFFYSEPNSAQWATTLNYLTPETAPIKRLNPNHQAIIIFIHGYKSSPYDFKVLAEHFSKNYDVVVPLLPGHGTSAADFKQTYFSQWYQAINDQYLFYRQQYKKVYIVGLSMGGTIALTLTETHQDALAPDGVVTLAAPVFLNNLLECGLIYNWQLYFSRLASWFITELNEPIRQVDDDGANKLYYQGKNYLKQLHSLKLGMARAKKNLSTIKAPLLLMHAKGDQTVPFENMAYIKKKIASKIVKTIVFDLSDWDHDRHMLTLYQTTQDQVIDEIERFLTEIKN